MDTQTDGTNLLPSFGPTGGSEALSWFGAYLDINQSTLRFPQTFVGDGPFATTLHSIRDLLEDHHQCMVVELLHSGDPTLPGATPGNSDNLAQRNLLVVQTANPGSPITRTVQHAFNIDLTRSLQRHRPEPDVSLELDHLHASHGLVHASDEAEPAMDEQPDVRDEADAIVDQQPVLANCCAPIRVEPARPDAGQGHAQRDLDHELKHLAEGWLAGSERLLAKLVARTRERAQTRERWSIDLERWKPTTGLDELVFFWNNLPREAVVHLYLPGINVEEVFNFRSLRHAPRTVGIVDSETLRLFPRGTTYLPIPPFWGDNLAGLLSVELPAGIKKGQRFAVDVVQMRGDEARTLGGFRLDIQVEKAVDLFAAEARWLRLFHRRLSIKHPGDRWRPILERQVAFTRARARGLVELANEEDPKGEPREWKDPTRFQAGRNLRVVLEKIRISDDHEPCFKGKGEFRFCARVWTPDNGGLLSERAVPETKYFVLGDTEGTNEVTPNALLFDGWAEQLLALEIRGVELDTFDPDDRLVTFKRIFRGDPATWVGRYGPTGGIIDEQDMGDWQIWYRIEHGG